MMWLLAFIVVLIVALLILALIGLLLKVIGRVTDKTLGLRRDDGTE